ncbi:MAG TPA: hypothetical protein VLA24_01800 [Pseudomonadales bacterium]|nr:hypothetical protein [Pseudomonadales bacterium]
MSKITLLMIVLAIAALYFGVFGWFLAGLFVFWAGARTYLKFEEPPITPPADQAESDKH